MKKNELYISDGRKLELFKKNYKNYSWGELEIEVKEFNGVKMNVVTFPSDLPDEMLLQYVWAIGVSVGLELCQIVINGTTSPISPLDKVEEVPEKKL